jgi:DNA-binding NarL/FixJ family response regulator
LNKTVRVAILDDHQSIIDGFIYRITPARDIQVVASAAYGEDLLPMLRSNSPVDVLLLDMSVPTSSSNLNQYPMIFALRGLMDEFPKLKVVVISNFKEKGLVKAAIEHGVRGYIFKDDQASIQQLARIVMIVAAGGNYFSAGAYFEMGEEKSKRILTRRQVEVMTVATAYPDDSTEELAERLKISGSTLRNILSEAYTRLGVRTRSSAIDRVRQLGIVPSAQKSSLNGDGL